MDSGGDGGKDGGDGSKDVGGGSKDDKQLPTDQGTAGEDPSKRKAVGKDGKDIKRTGLDPQVLAGQTEGGASGNKPITAKHREPLLGDDILEQFRHLTVDTIRLQSSTMDDEGEGLDIDVDDDLRLMNGVDYNGTIIIIVGNDIYVEHDIDDVDEPKPDVPDLNEPQD